MGALADLFHLPGDIVSGVDASWRAIPAEYGARMQYYHAQLDALRQLGIMLGGGQQQPAQPQAGGILGQPQQPAPTGILAPSQDDILAGIKGPITLPALTKAAMDAGQQQPAPTAAPTATPRRGLPTLEEAGPALAFANLAGLPQAKGLQDLLVAEQPHITSVNGWSVNDKDPGEVGKYHPALKPDEVPLFDQYGNFAGVKNADGSVKSAAEMTAATTDAQEAAKAHYSITQVPRSDGTSQSMTTYDAARALSGGGQGGNGAPGAGVGGAVLGVTRAPEQETLAKGRADTQVQREQQQPMKAGALADQDRATDFVIKQLGDALNNAHWDTTGLVGSAMSHVKGSPSYNLQATLDGIKARIGFDQLQQLRDESPTGGALGRVTQQEINLLQSLNGSLDQWQGTPQFKQHIQDVLEQLQAIRKQRHDLYNSTYPQQTAQASGPQPAPAEVEAEMRRRGLLK